MSYLVLARKWRPQTFHDVVGQDIIVKTLSKALESGRIAHAFLFTGSRGVGKTSVARLLAKALACEQGISPSPCGQCAHCQEITAGTSIDVIEIDGASNTSVDDVRDLRETIRYQPSSCRFKIFIIDEVHMLSNSAFNALLKTLEEPPPHVKFIFATTESHKIPITILSRCQRYDFKRLSTETIIERLQSILKLENISIDPAGLLLIAQAAEGGMRDALSLTDQVLSFSAEHASLDDVTQILGLFDRQSVLQCVDAVITKDAKSALAVVEKTMLGGYDVKQLMDAVTTEFRHLALAASTGSIDGFADLTRNDIEAIDSKAKNLDAADLQRLFAMGLDSIDQIARSEQPRLMTELAVLRMADRPPMAEAMTIAHAISRLEALANGAPRVAKETAPITLSPPLPIKTINDDNIEGVDEKWLRFVNVVTHEIAAIGHHLEHARVLRVIEGNDKNIIQIELSHQLHHQMITEALSNPRFRALFSQHYGSKTLLEPILSETATKDAPLTINEARDVAAKKAQEALEAEARNHPVVQKALALFGGEIRSVKKNKADTMPATKDLL